MTCVVAGVGFVGTVGFDIAHYRIRIFAAREGAKGALCGIIIPMEISIMTTKLLASFLLAVAFAVPSRLAAQGPDGTDFGKAIPIYFGQTLTDIMDGKTKPDQIYSIVLAKGQSFSVTAKATSSNPFWTLILLAPNTKIGARSCSDGAILASGGCGSSATSMSFTYQVATAGTYYVVLSVGSTGTAFQLKATAEGTPIAVPNPPSAGCLTGRVDYLTYSLQLIAAGLADEVSIGGSKVCATCTVKAPLYPEIVNRLENALRSKVNVEACYDSTGSIFQIKLVTP